MESAENLLSWCSDTSKTAIKQEGFKPYQRGLAKYLTQAANEMTQMLKSYLKI